MRPSTVPGKSPAMVQMLLSTNIVAAVIFAGVLIALARARYDRTFRGLSYGARTFRGRYSVIAGHGIDSGPMGSRQKESFGEHER